MQKDSIQVKNKVSKVEMNHTALESVENAKPISPVSGNLITGFTRKINSEIKEWLFLQKEILLYPFRVEKSQKQIENLLHDYRLFITSLVYKAHRADSTVWNLYLKILGEIEQTRLKTTQRSLRLRTLYQLRDLQTNWVNICQQQSNLIELIPQTNASLEFYDKMMKLKAIRQVRRVKRAAEMRKVDEARESLMAAIAGVRKIYENAGVNYSSRLVDLAESQQIWEDQLNEITQEELSPTMDVDNLVSRIHALEMVIREAPALTLRVREVEVKLARITKTYALLLENGVSVIPQQEVNRITTKLYDQVPELWRSGKKQELEAALGTLEDFLSSYENSVEAEMAFLERRKPGSTRSLSLMQSDPMNVINQLSSFSKSLVNAIDARDRFMRGHSANVARVALMIGQQLGWSPIDLEYITMAGYLHDVGKISIPESILSKKDPLTPEDWKIIQMHPYFGAQILKPIESLSKIIPWVLYHQEKWDGTGYPNQLTQEQIPEGAAIIALAEAYASMVTDLPSRNALSKDDAIAIITQNSGAQFSPKVVEAFLSIPNLISLNKTLEF